MNTDRYLKTTRILRFEQLSLNKSLRRSEIQVHVLTQKHAETNSVTVNTTLKSFLKTTKTCKMRLIHLTKKELICNISSQIKKKSLNNYLNSIENSSSKLKKWRKRKKSINLEWKWCKRSLRSLMMRIPSCDESWSTWCIWWKSKNRRIIFNQISCQIHCFREKDRSGDWHFRKVLLWILPRENLKKRNLLFIILQEQEMIIKDLMLFDKFWLKGIEEELIQSLNL